MPPQQLKRFDPIVEFESDPILSLRYLRDTATDRCRQQVRVDDVYSALDNPERQCLIDMRDFRQVAEYCLGLDVDTLSPADKSAANSAADRRFLHKPPRDRAGGPRAVPGAPGRRRRIQVNRVFTDERRLLVGQTSFSPTFLLVSRRTHNKNGRVFIMLQRGRRQLDVFLAGRAAPVRHRSD